MANKPIPTACPCGNSSYTKCCARFITDGHIPATAAELMRSRYSAFVLRDEAYLAATWHPDTLPTDSITGEDDVKWIGLNIVKHQQHDDNNATVEFIARFKVGGRAHRLHEVSQFVRLTPDNLPAHWVYVEGTFPDDA